LKILIRTQDVFAFEFEGTRYDAGDKLGFLKANISLALKRPDLKADLRKFLRNIKN